MLSMKAEAKLRAGHSVTEQGQPGAGESHASGSENLSKTQLDLQVSKKLTAAIMSDGSVQQPDEGSAAATPAESVPGPAEELAVIMPAGSIKEVPVADRPTASLQCADEVPPSIMPAGSIILASEEIIGVEPAESGTQPKRVVHRIMPVGSVMYNCRRHVQMNANAEPTGINPVGSVPLPNDHPASMMPAESTLQPGSVLLPEEQPASIMPAGSFLLPDERPAFIMPAGSFMLAYNGPAASLVKPDEAPASIMPDVSTLQPEEGPASIMPAGSILLPEDQPASIMPAGSFLLPDERPTFIMPAGSFMLACNGPAVSLVKPDEGPASMMPDESTLQPQEQPASIMPAGSVLFPEDQPASIMPAGSFLLPDERPAFIMPAGSFMLACNGPAVSLVKPDEGPASMMPDESTLQPEEQPASIMPAGSVLLPGEGPASIMPAGSILLPEDQPASIMPAGSFLLPDERPAFIMPAGSFMLACNGPAASLVKPDEGPASMMPDESTLQPQKQPASIMPAGSVLFPGEGPVSIMPDESTLQPEEQPASIMPAGSVLLPGEGPASIMPAGSILLPEDQPASIMPAGSFLLPDERPAFIMPAGSFMLACNGPAASLVKPDEGPASMMPDESTLQPQEQPASIMPAGSVLLPGEGPASIMPCESTLQPEEGPSFIMPAGSVLLAREELVPVDPAKSMTLEKSENRTMPLRSVMCVNRKHMDPAHSDIMSQGVPSGIRPVRLVTNTDSLTHPHRFPPVGAAVVEQRRWIPGMSLQVTSMTVGDSSLTDTYVSSSGKEIMKDLNDRLASYLERVRLLESTNCSLEEHIREWNETRSLKPRDTSGYVVAISCLCDQILSALQDKSRLVTEAENLHLAALQLQSKYEEERAERLSNEAFIRDLRKTLEEITEAGVGLAQEAQQLQEEQLVMKMNHKEDLLRASRQQGRAINVDVKLTQQDSLGEVMDQVRAQCADVLERSLEQLDSWLKTKFESHCHPEACPSDKLQSSQTEVSSLRHSAQDLEITLSSLLSMNDTLERSLQETEEQNSGHLGELQALIHMMEANLTQIKTDAAHQQQEYNVLLGIKSKLETEITKYHHLLDQGDKRAQHN
ncbi:nascent polypeptide-associated complex subunit alpha, muscle-specific form-like isoform X8 [Erpetoichthys calabaricus]|uniref:nascent polypeptide-associated complex subunit alpha, muscle-specific form-like isoform X8 n=1 Tax=Erpetoichthys calabaricus TaxID=27687 RepID=UPI002233E465|nr:nascent polypeptide-associated complex subunit alpha, muscle-specific form-like isoform X8 [Erpetoichthys calabaricus]